MSVDAPALDSSSRALRVLGLASLALIFPTETLTFSAQALADSPATAPGSSCWSPARCWPGSRCSSAATANGMLGRCWR